MAGRTSPAGRASTLFPLGGLARRARRAAGTRDPAAARQAGREAREPATPRDGASGSTSPSTRAGLERGAGAGALRAALRGGAGPRGGHGDAGPSPIRVPGEPMALDHRRILATGIARLRGKIKYRPVVFELMPPTSPCCSCSAPSRRWPAGRCTSRTSAAWSSSRAWSRRPARDRRTPAAGRPSSSASAARCCASAPSPAQASARPLLACGLRTESPDGS